MTAEVSSSRNEPGCINDPARSDDLGRPTLAARFATRVRNQTTHPPAFGVSFSALNVFRISKPSPVTTFYIACGLFDLAQRGRRGNDQSAKLHRTHSGVTTDMGAKEIAMLPIASIPAAIKSHLRFIPSPFFERCRLFRLKRPRFILPSTRRLDATILKEDA